MQTEFLVFRMFKMPCCGHLLCWVNPRLPNFCTECGSRVYTKLKFEPAHTIFRDEESRLIHKNC